MPVLVCAFAAFVCVAKSMLSFARVLIGGVFACTCVQCAVYRGCICVHMPGCTFVRFSDVTFWVCLRLKLKFLCYSAEHSTGVECECGVHAVKLHQVRRSGKFGEAKAEQKEWNLASSLGSERFLLAFCQKSRHSAKHNSKSYITLLLLSYVQECCNENMKTDSFWQSTPCY